MSNEKFRLYLIGRQIPENEIHQHVYLADQFESFIEEICPAGQTPSIEHARAFIARLYEQNEDTYQNILALARYGRFTQNNAVFLAALELVDGGEAMENLYVRLGRSDGEPVRDQIFRDLDLPSPGTPNLEKARRMQVVIQRMIDELGEGLTCHLLSDCLRDLQDDDFACDRQRYMEYPIFDDYLELKREEFLIQLEEIMNSGGLYFNQEITPEVIAYVRNNPEISSGARKDNLLYVTKIPYMAKEYLAESDPDQKRYYYCHCPWARESLKPGEKRVPSIFCCCSAGFIKKPWEGIFNQPLRVDVLQSVLKGDLQCRFAIHLPLSTISP